MKRILFSLLVFLTSLPAHADYLEKHLTDFAGTWSVIREDKSVEAEWANKYGSWVLFLEIKKRENNTPLIDMRYETLDGLIPVSIFDAHISDNALIILATFVIPGQHDSVSTQYRFPFKNGQLIGRGDYYEVHEVVTGPDMQTDTESLSGKFIFKKGNPKQLIEEFWLSLPEAKTPEAYREIKEAAGYDKKYLDCEECVDNRIQGCTEARNVRLTTKARLRWNKACKQTCDEACDGQGC